MMAIAIVGSSLTVKIRALSCAVDSQAIKHSPNLTSIQNGDCTKYMCFNCQGIEGQGSLPRTLIRTSIDEDVAIVRRHIDIDRLICVGDRNFERGCARCIIDHFAIGPWLWKRNCDRLLLIGKIKEYDGKLLGGRVLSAIGHYAVFRPGLLIVVERLVTAQSRIGVPERP